MEVRTHTSETELRDLERTWNELHTAADGTVFQTFQWNCTWWNIYRRDHLQLHIVSFWDNGQLVGLLPMFLETINARVTHMSRLRFLGTYEIYGEYAPIIHPMRREGVLNAMVDYCAGLVSSGDVDMLSFFRFPSTSTFMGRLLEELRARNLNVSFTRNCVARVMMPLPRTWDEYRSSLTPSERQSLGRRTRALMNSGVELEVVDGTGSTDDAFRDFVKLHTASWLDRGGKGYFGTLRQFEKFQRSITAALAPLNMAQLYFLKKDGRRFAAVQAFSANRHFCFYLSGLDRHDAMISHSPGKVLLSLVIKDAIDRGFEEFDFQGGVESYKFQLGGRPEAFSKALVWKKGPAGFKVYLFSGLQATRRIVREKIWDDGVAATARRIVRKFRRMGRAAGSSEIICSVP
ncbi:MAG TPA: GNAT family N-acetyltransferase [Bacteroidota bacterium]|nr:GNAT family N-acetyltransferase [Bacteroidota bacterium]